MNLTVDTKRRLLFLLGCIPMRYFLAYVVSRLSGNYLRVAASIYMFIAFALAYLAVTGKRTTGPETFGKDIWWTPHLRIIHAIIFMLFAVLAFKENSKAYYLLYLDATIGLLAFLFHEFA